VTEIRRNLITGEPVIFAPERASRPNAFDAYRRERLSPHCPFCPGHEDETPPEIARSGDPWRVRVFANKYPTTPRHEVIVESPRHDATFAAIEHPAEIVAMYIERYRAISAPHVAIFKNHGPMGGASLEHIHSQIAGMTFVPPRVERELAAFAAQCPLCEPDAIVIEESEHFRRIAPRGSAFAYEQWIVPRRHAPNFAAMSDDAIDDLGMRLRDVATSMERIAASYNWLFMNFADTAHWYVQAMPRITTIAGFELATGTFINIVDPERTCSR
jgi:UDPglucose--hexose-1-phosphate uridylyltransferase